MNRAQRYLAGGLVLAAAGLFGPGALGQGGTRSQLGSIAARAPRAVTVLNKANTEIELSGGVSVQTDRGDLLTADRVTVTLATNPATKKLDAKTVAASGNVRLKTVETITPQGATPYKRVINASAANAVLNKFQNTVALNGNVTVTADDPTASYSWRNAARATMDLTTKRIEADAPNGEKMNVEVKPKG